MSIEGIIGIVLILIGVAGGWFVRGKKAVSDQSKAVDQAKTDTEAQVRTEAANESQAKAEQAVADASKVRKVAEQVASTAEASGDEALNDELRKQGMLRD